MYLLRILAAASLLSIIFDADKISGVNAFLLYSSIASFNEDRFPLSNGLDLIIFPSSTMLFASTSSKIAFQISTYPLTSKWFFFFSL